MSILRNEFISTEFLRSVWGSEYEHFKGSDDEGKLFTKLTNWSERTDLKETSAEGAFVSTFFEELWGYTHSGRNDGKPQFNLSPQHAIQNAGQGGGTGSADLAIGCFNQDGVANIPQILCEFKDIKSSLDAPQKRRGNNRSPVKQALDYLSQARRGMFGKDRYLDSIEAHLHRQSGCLEVRDCSGQLAQTARSLRLIDRQGI